MLACIPGGLVKKPTKIHNIIDINDVKPPSLFPVSLNLAGKWPIGCRLVWSTGHKVHPVAARRWPKRTRGPPAGCGSCWSWTRRDSGVSEMRPGHSSHRGRGAEGRWSAGKRTLEMCRDPLCGRVRSDRSRDIAVDTRCHRAVRCHRPGDNLWSVGTPSDLQHQSPPAELKFKKNCH